MARYYRGSRKNREILFIMFRATKNITCSNGFYRTFISSKWRNAKGDIRAYIKSVLALKDDPTYATEDEFKIAFKRDSNGTISQVNDNTKLGVEVSSHTTKNRLTNKKIAKRNSEKVISTESKQLTNPSYVIIRYADKSTTKQPADNESMKVREYKLLESKLHIAEADLRKVQKENTTLLRENENLKRMLENAQKYIKSIVNVKSSIFKTQNKQYEIIDKISFKASANLDGSSGLYQQRENGRFGSYPSFDNYDDEYNEKDDPTKHEEF